jgi:Double zinc ribbon
MTRKRILGILFLLLGGLLTVSLCLPWFHLPLFSWSVPTPAWNYGGLACFCLACCCLLRGVGGSTFRWLLRLVVLPSWYFWWQSTQQMKAWGAANLAPAQLKLSTVNDTLARLGAETVSLYDPIAWKGLEPDSGWYLTGGCLAVVSILTLLDGPKFLACPGCRAKAGDSDSFCFSCGHSLKSSPGCRNCGSRIGPEDKFCRTCGSGLPDSQE